MGEFAAIERIRRLFPSPPPGQAWIGDDTAVLDDGLLLAVDTVVAGVHFGAGTPLADVGWKALTVNVSDIAAMGGTPGHAVVAVAAPPDIDLDLIYEGMAEASETYGCPVVGGDLSNAKELVVTVALTGHVDGAPVLRSGARPGDGIYVTGPLGGAAATSYRARPQARVAEGTAARLAGATAMIDVSDGLVADLNHIAETSGVGYQLHDVPVADGATEDQALHGGEDFELVFTGIDLAMGIRIGTCTADPSQRLPARLGAQVLVTRPVALTIAGSDSGGGAGIVADLKTFEAHDVWGTAAVVAVTAQNTIGVQAVETVTPTLVKAQIESVVTDIGVDAAKTGMLASAELTRTVAACLRDLGVPNLVVDPVLVSKHGDILLTDDAVGALVSDLIPLATVVTPNLPEASRLVGFEVDTREAMAQAGMRIVDMGARVALVKGGHLGGEDSPDCLVSLDGGVTWLEAGRIPGRHTHGTGCVLSAAIAAELAGGMEPADACVAAKRFLERAIASGLDLGSGVGPVNPGWGRQA